MARCKISTRHSQRFGANLAYRIQIAQPAIQDAKNYAAFIRDEQHAPEPARRWLDGLYEAIRELSESPNRFSVIPEAEELGFPYRSFVYHSHRVVYAVDDTSLIVMVHRVYHGARQPLTEKDLH